VSELPLHAPGANPSVRARLSGGTTPTRTRSLTVVDQGGPRSIDQGGTQASARSVADSAPGDAWTDLESPASHHHDDDALTVADAARLARRSVRTLRRAYLSGKLTAHRDGNGRGVSIRYGDLRAWLTAEVIAASPAASPSRAIARANVRGRTDPAVETGNTELLTAALQHRTRRVRASAGPRPAGKRSWTGRS
jgi:excisionase family DNA binding protein